MSPPPQKKLIPYRLTKKETPTLILYKLSVFLTLGGKGLWELSLKENPEEILTVNDFFADSLHEKNNRIYAKINEKKTNLESFYTWEETKKEDCWRTFHICLEVHSNKPWFHSEYLNETFDGTNLSPSTLLTDILSLKE